MARRSRTSTDARSGIQTRNPHCTADDDLPARGDTRTWQIGKEHLMSTTIETPPEARSLEDELHELQSDEQRLETRLQESHTAVAIAASGALIPAVEGFA